MGVDSIMVNKEQITEIYSDYTKSLLEVNRTYQRKLVWTLEEKQKLIDTIFHKYPIPLFIFATHRVVSKDNKITIRREIIDGLQRLEAIVSFINNEFPVMVNGEEGYFNLSASPFTIPMVNSGELNQKEPVLNDKLCGDFMVYFLATTTVEADNVSVEDVFKRINSTGRQLSSQELRQAGIISKFSDMVQKLASQIRGDYTKQDIILLEDMQKYSLSSGELPYGIDIRKVFWTKQNIINFDALRRSKDEEILAHICNCILSEYQSGASKKTLDALYDENSYTFKRNEQRLTEERQILLTDQILDIFEDIKNALKCAKQSFKAHITRDDRSPNTDLVFIVIFLAIYQLKSKGYYFPDYNSLAKSLQGIADEELFELINEEKAIWNRENRNRWIERIVSRIKKCMNLNKTSHEADKELRELLARAVTEEQMYDFKLGVTTLKDGTFNTDMVIKCIKTLIAMSNTKPHTKGYVVLGIANDKDAANAFEQHYGKRAIKYNNLYVTGVEAEAVKYYNNMDRYLQKISNVISTLESKVSPNVIHNILTNVHIMPYDGGSLVVLSLRATDAPLYYDNKLFVRYQSSNKELLPGSPEFNAVYRSFSENT